MSTNIDGRGLACPGPVIAVKKALEGISTGIVTIFLDNPIAKENVFKFATAHGCSVRITEEDGGFSLRICKGEVLEEVAVCPELAITSDTSDTVYVFLQDKLGHGNPELGRVLMKGFMYTLIETTPRPKTLLFMNSAVLLTIEGSPVIDHLRALAGEGVKIIACGTCLDYFAVKDKLAVGEISNMYTIVEIMTAAPKVITL